MTGAIAERYGIAKRGALIPGYFADVTVFNPDLLQVKTDQPDYRPDGICHVMVNGVFAVEKGRYQSQQTGKVLKKGKEITE